MIHYLGLTLLLTETFSINDALKERIDLAKPEAGRTHLLGSRIVQIFTVKSVVSIWW